MGSLINLCEKCFPDSGTTEVLTIVSFLPCDGCGAVDERHIGGERVHTFRKDPRPSVSHIHTCSYFCARPACILAQRDELRDAYVMPVEPAPDAVRFTILGEPASKANQRKVVTIAGHASLIKSQKARSFEQVALLQIPPAAKRMFTGDVQVSMRIFYASRRPDLDESVVLDVLQAKFTGIGKARKLVRAGVYLNDRQVKRKVIDWGLDPSNPRVEIEVQPLEQTEL